jgi:hypothetical protein
VDLSGARPVWSGKAGAWLALRDDTSISLYTASGKLLAQRRLSFQNPVCKAAGDRLLTYDRGSTGLRVDFGAKTLFEAQMGGVIHCADLSDCGALAVAAETDGYRSQVTVYSKSYQELLRYSTENFITALSLSPKGEKLAAASVSASGGMLISSVYLLSVSQSGEPVRLELQDELILSLRYKSDGKIHMITDRAVVLMDESGAEKARFDYGGRELAAFDTAHEKYDLVLLGNYREDKKQELVLLDASLAEAGRRIFSARITGLQAEAQIFCLYFEGWAESYDYTLVPMGSYETPDALTAAAVGDTLYYATARQLRAVSLE